MITHTITVTCDNEDPCPAALVFTERVTQVFHEISNQGWRNDLDADETVNYCPAHKDTR